MSTDDELLGAWVLDALDAEEREQIDAALVEDGHSRMRADHFRNVVAALAEQDSSAPPAGLRDRVLDAARRSPRRAERPTGSSPVELYRRRALELSELLARLDVPDWQQPAVPYRWTVHGLMAHLLVIERYMNVVLRGEVTSTRSEVGDHLAMGAADIDAELRRDPRETVHDWWAVLEQNLVELEAADLERSIVFHVWPFTVSSLLVARGFELWTHADDIRRATGAAMVDPPVEDVVTMSTVSVGSLPLAIHVVAGGHVPDASVRIVLTGAAGGSYDLQLGAGGDRLVTMSMDVVDYCRVVARRIERSDAGLMVDGDDALADQLLRASSIIAV